MARQRDFLFTWCKGKNPVGNAVCLAAGVVIVVAISPILIGYMLFVRFGIPATSGN